MTNPGEVNITLGDKEYTLKPTLAAARAINSIHNGFLGAIHAVGQFNFDTITMIVAVATGRRNEADKVAEEVLACGMRDLIAPISKFIELLSNGGKPVGDVQGSAEGKDGNG